MKRSKFLMIGFIFIVMLLAASIQSQGIERYVSWIYFGNQQEPSFFPKNDTNYAITEVACIGSEANWDDDQKLVKIDIGANGSVCDIYVEDTGEASPPSQEQVLDYENDKQKAEQELLSCTTKKQEQADNKKLIADAIVAASGELTDGENRSFQYLGSFISSALYEFPTSYTYSHCVALSGSSSGSNRTASDTIAFSLPFKFRPSVTGGVSSQYHADCSGGISSYDQYGFSWSVRNNGSGTGNCCLNYTFRN